MKIVKLKKKIKKSPKKNIVNKKHHCMELLTRYKIVSNINCKGFGSEDIIIDLISNDFLSPGHKYILYLKSANI